jgi:hypothetical protein
LYGPFDEVVTWIGNGRGACIAEEGNVTSLFESLEEDLCLFLFVMIVIACEVGMDLVVVEELLGVPCVLGCNNLHLLENLEGAQGDVLKIANGGSNNIEYPGRGCHGVLSDLSLAKRFLASDLNKKGIGLQRTLLQRLLSGILTVF